MSRIIPNVFIHNDPISLGGQRPSKRRQSRKLFSGDTYDDEVLHLPSTETDSQFVNNECDDDDDDVLGLPSTERREVKRVKSIRNTRRHDEYDDNPDSDVLDLPDSTI